MSITLGTSIASHAAAIALGAIAAAALPSAHLAKPQSLADYMVAICAKTFHSCICGGGVVLSRQCQRDDEDDD